MGTAAVPLPTEQSHRVPAEVVQVVKHAVKAQEQLWARYRGRVQRMWPHVLGWRQGRLYVLGFFLDAAEPTISRWEWVAVSDLGEPRARPGVWIGSPRASRPSSAFLDRVLVECEEPAS
ncbi:MAG: hypothetical protein ACE147_09910 [Candidatus Methylomirabilales bacterium]